MTTTFVPVRTDSQHKIVIFMKLKTVIFAKIFITKMKNRAIETNVLVPMELKLLIVRQMRANSVIRAVWATIWNQIYVSTTFVPVRTDSQHKIVKFMKLKTVIFAMNFITKMKNHALETIAHVTMATKLKTVQLLELNNVIHATQATI